jgi:hypothetical protein
MDVEYFDQNDGKSRFRMLVGDREIGQWVADCDLPSSRPDGGSSTRHRIVDLALCTGDEI